MGDLDVIYVPSHDDIVRGALKMAGVDKNTVVVDLGCGDGRVLVTAAKMYGCKAYGVDLDPQRVKESQQAVHKLGLNDLVAVERKNLFDVQLHKLGVAKGPIVIFLYLLPEMIERLLPALFKCPKGTQIVAHDAHPEALGLPKQHLVFYAWNPHDLFLWSL